MPPSRPQHRLSYFWACGLAAALWGQPGVAVAAPAQATSGFRGTVAVHGSVAQSCAIRSPELLTDTAPVNVASLNGETLLITQLVEASSLAVKATSFDVGFAASCNFAHQLNVETQNNGLWPETGPVSASGFANAVPYVADVTWADNTAELKADALSKRIASVSLRVNSPTQGEIKIQFRIYPGASNAGSYAPLLAGNYHDTIRVTLEPQ